MAERQTNLQGNFKKVGLSNLDTAEGDLHLPEKVFETGTINNQPEAENNTFCGESSGEKNWGTKECQLSEEEHNVYALPACLMKRHVAVTGAGGFIASWIVKLLLQRGFYVRGILRNIGGLPTHIQINSY